MSKGPEVRRSMAPLGDEAGSTGREGDVDRVDAHQRGRSDPTAGLGVGETQVGPLWGSSCVSQAQGRRNLGASNRLALEQIGLEGGAIHRAAEGSLKMSLQQRG